MQTSKCTCDGCGADLTETGNCLDYRLALVVQLIPNFGPTAALMHIKPPISGDKHFCGIDCLRTWVDKQRIAANQAAKDALGH
jgi:hypothetical protein